MLSSWEPPIGIEPMTYALRGCHRALLASSKPGLASCSQVADGGDRWQLMAVRGHIRGHGSVMRRPRSRRDGAVERPSASGRTYPQLAQIVRMLCAVAGRRCQRLAAAVAVSHSRFGGQAGTQASDPTPAPGQNPASRAAVRGLSTSSLPITRFTDLQRSKHKRCPYQLVLCTAADLSRSNYHRTKRQFGHVSVRRPLLAV